MTPVELLTDLERRNVRIEAVGERIRFAPSHLVTPELRAALARHKKELITLLTTPDPEVGWRAIAMRPAVPRRGPIPFVVARPLPEIPAGHCQSCGDAIDESRRGRCAPCVAALELVLNEVREGLNGKDGTP